jgi:ribosomal-protein-alanine N-acetyltransferase
MKDLPKPILGEITALTITTPDLEKSLTFYKKLGFSEALRADWPFPWIQVSDGVLLIMLRKDPKPYIALTYYVKNIDKVTAAIEQKGIKFTQKPKKTDMLKRYLLQSPDGLNISLVSIVDGFSQPKGPGMLQMKKEDYFKPEKYINKTCGLFGELAHPVKDLEASLAFWGHLGFKTVTKFASPYPWAIISDGLSIVGLHESTHFASPAITYFAADMQDKIAKLKKSGLKDLTDRGQGNFVLTTPEGQHIFLFSLSGTPEQKKKPEIKQPILETERLLLRELNPEVLEELYTTYSDEDIITFLGVPGIDEMRIEKSNWELGLSTYRTTYKSFLMQEKTTGKIIGKAGFHNWYPLHKRAELGYALSDESAKRKGYTTEAVAAIIAHGFDILGLNRIEAYVGKENIPSLKIIRGSGFTEEGTLRSHFFKNGKIEDSVCFSILHHEYEALRSKNKKTKKAKKA